jgi:preprotein translocase subunit SecD
MLILGLTILFFTYSYDFESKSFRIKLGLDLKSGSHIAIKLLPVEDDQGKTMLITPQIIDQTMAVLTRRLNPRGVQEIVIQREGTDRLVIEIPEVTDVKEAEGLIRKTAYLEFKEQYFDPTEKKDKWRKVMDGTSLDAASAQIRSNGEPYVEFSLRKDAHRKFAEVTERNVNKPLGIFLDGELIDAPNVGEPITGGHGIISGGKMTLEDCQRLAVLLNAGSLPVNVEILESMTVSPTLGFISLMKSLSAMIIGLILVMTFMIWYYKVPGLLANVALVVYAVWVMFSMVVGNFVLTLPGIAGFILSIGMAVDANVLIFERLREEMMADKSLKSSIDLGFNRAFTSILDGHVTTFLGALILYYMGSASIKGFGLTLMLGTFWSMITAVFFTRVMVDFTVNHLEDKKLYA